MLALRVNDLCRLTTERLLRIEAGIADVADLLAAGFGGRGAKSHLRSSFRAARCDLIKTE